MITVGAYRGVMIWLPAEPAARGGAERVPRPATEAEGRARRAAPAEDPGRVALRRDARPRARGPARRDARRLSPERSSLYGPAGRAEIVREDRDGARVALSRTASSRERTLSATPGPPPRPSSARPTRPDEWLEATAETEYPDLVVQLPEFFDSPRSPDVFVSPEDGYGFTKGYVAGHGSLSRSETVVPFLFAGPGVSPGVLHAARTVDLAPTLLSYLGVAYDPDEMDGDDLEIAPRGVPRRRR